MPVFLAQKCPARRRLTNARLAHLQLESNQIEHAALSFDQIVLLKQYPDITIQL